MSSRPPSRPAARPASARPPTAIIPPSNASSRPIPITVPTNAPIPIQPPTNIEQPRPTAKRPREELPVQSSQSQSETRVSARATENQDISSLMDGLIADNSSKSKSFTQLNITRPVAQTKNGVRQFVEASRGARLFLQNFVASFDLQCKPDLAHIATHTRNAEYNPQRFGAVVMRLREPKCALLIFSSGKVVITGTKCEEDAVLAAKRCAKILQQLSYECGVYEFRIQNMVATGDCGFPIRLEGIAEKHGNYCSYEPELFPGLIYRMKEPRVVVLIFVSGKVVITGAKTRSGIIQAMDNIFPVVLQFKKPNAATLNTAK